MSNLTNLIVECGRDLESAEIAERFIYFFKSVKSGDASKMPGREVAALKKVRNKKLGMLRVRLGTLDISSKDRLAFSTFARRVLNVLNAMKYPTYGPSVKMDSYDAKYFNFLRY